MKIELIDFTSAERENINDFWEYKVARENFTLSMNYLRLLQRSGVNSYFFISKEDLQITSICYITCLKIKKYAVSFSVLLFGSEKTNGKAFWYDDNVFSYTEYLALIKSELKRCLGFDFLILRDYSSVKDEKYLTINQNAGFLNYHAFTNNVLNTDVFSTFEDYILSLTSRKRNFLKSIIKIRERQGLKISYETLNSELIASIYPLYADTNSRAVENRTMPLPIVFFEKLSQTIRHQVVVVRLENRILAFGLMLLGSSNLKCLFAGFNYEFSKQYSLWYQVVVASISYSIYNGFKIVDLGSTSSLMKAKFQSTPSPVYLSILFKNPLCTRLFQTPLTFILSRFLKPERSNSI